MSQIISTAELSTYMQGKATNVALIQQVVAAVNQWIETRTKRCFGETKQVTDEAYTWNSIVWLRHPDIVSIDSVTLGWPGKAQSTLDANSYFVSPLGRLSFFTLANPNLSRLYNDYLHISYTYGFLVRGSAADDSRRSGRCWPPPNTSSKPMGSSLTYVPA